MMKYSNKIVIHPLTIIYLLFCFYEKKFGYFFSFIILSFTHEMFHVFVASLFHCHIASLTVLPIGCNAEIDGLNNLRCWQAILILLAGPLSIVIMVPIIKFLYHLELYQYPYYAMFIEQSISLFIFNLIPITPLDGGKIIKYIYSFFLEEKHALIASYVTDIIVAGALIIYLIYLAQYVLIGLIIISLILNAFLIKKRYQHFLLSRLYKTGKPLKVRINETPSIYKNYDNYLYRNGNIYGEDYIINCLLKK